MSEVKKPRVAPATGQPYWLWIMGGRKNLIFYVSMTANIVMTSTGVLDPDHFVTFAGVIIGAVVGVNGVEWIASALAARKSGSPGHGPIASPVSDPTTDEMGYVD